MNGAPVRGSSPPISTLFIVPCEAAGTRSGSAWANAPSSTSTMRWEVSTLPAATAAGARGFTREPSGALTVRARWAPALAGMSGSVTARSTY